MFLHALQAALSTYLLDSVEENTKNAIVLYLLFDMAAVAHGQQEQVRGSSTFKSFPELSCEMIGMFGRQDFCCA